MEVFVQLRQLSQDLAFGLLLLWPGTEGDGPGIRVNRSLRHLVDALERGRLFLRRWLGAELFVVLG